MKQLQILRRDDLVVDFLRRHKGKDNCASSKQIAEFLNEQGFYTKVNAVHQIIRKLITERTIPVCQINAKGYFWAETQTEIQSSIDDFQHRISEMQTRIEILKNFIIK